MLSGEDLVKLFHVRDRIISSNARTSFDCLITWFYDNRNFRLKIHKPEKSENKYSIDLLLQEGSAWKKKYAFIVNREHLLFYFLDTDKYSDPFRTRLQEVFGPLFKDMPNQGRGSKKEMTVKIENSMDTTRLLNDFIA